MLSCVLGQEEGMSQDHSIQRNMGGLEPIDCFRYNVILNPK